MAKNPSPTKEQGVNSGLPLLDLADKPYSWFEFLPAWLVYLPVVAYWILLSLRYRNFGLPMLANPNIELGGMVGESKSAILEQAGSYARRFILPWAVYLKACGDQENTLSQIQSALETGGVDFPLIAKPDLGCRGNGVQKCRDFAELQDYLREFPNNRRVVLQQLAPWAAEAGVFYIRKPGAPMGEVVSLTLKYRATVIGDGTHTLLELIERNTRARRLKKIYSSLNKHCLNSVPEQGVEIALGFLGSHCKGSIFRNGGEWITPQLNDAIDAVMRDFPDFHYGRLDIKFRDIELLARGEQFCILEINGVSSEQTHIWDARASFRDAIGILFGQYRTLFEMGDAMRRRGLRPPSARRMIKIWLRELWAS